MIEIRYVFGHYEAYDNQGGFICSGDTEHECRKDYENTISAAKVETDANTAA